MTSPIVSRLIKFRAWNQKRCSFYKTYQGAYQPFGVYNNLYVTVSDPEDLIFSESTGIVDKDDTEIYEGDVVRNDRFHPDYAFLVRDIRLLSPALFASTSKKYLKVIGNIFEHPQLLERYTKK
jgi:hypothetical protein